MTKIRTLAAVFAFATGAALFAPACHSPEPRQPDKGLTPPVAPPQPPDLGRGPDRVSVDVYRVYLGDGTRGVCGGPDPYFAFDSAQTDTRQTPTMQVLANCMKDGPLRDKSIRLIGRADPRGTDDYNDKLGLERAERVKKYLVTQGVEADRIQTDSAGKRGAKATPDDWPADRRVDVELVK